MARDSVFASKSLLPIEPSALDCLLHTLEADPTQKRQRKQQKKTQRWQERRSDKKCHQCIAMLGLFLFLSASCDLCTLWGSIVAKSLLVVATAIDRFLMIFRVYAVNRSSTLAPWRSLELSDRRCKSRLKTIARYALQHPQLQHKQNAIGMWEIYQNLSESRKFVARCISVGQERRINRCEGLESLSGRSYWCVCLHIWSCNRLYVLLTRLM